MISWPDWGPTKKNRMSTSSIQLFFAHFGNRKQKKPTPGATAATMDWLHIGLGGPNCGLGSQQENCCTPGCAARCAIPGALFTFFWRDPSKVRNPWRPLFTCVDDLGGGAAVHSTEKNTYGHNKKMCNNMQLLVKARRPS